MARRRQPVPEHYQPVYPEKYKGNYPIVARSSWETEFMKFCDHNSNVLEWVSEPTFANAKGIPYRDPLTNDQKIYIPDFLIRYIDARGQTQHKLIEIKPMHEAIFEYCRNSKDEAVFHRNIAKWTAARSWCERRGIEFDVFTEQQLFGGFENAKPPVRKPEKPGRKRRT